MKGARLDCSGKGPHIRLGLVGGVCTGTKGKGCPAVFLSFWPMFYQHSLTQGECSGGPRPKVVPVVPSDLELEYCPFSQGANWVSQVNTGSEPPEVQVWITRTCEGHQVHEGLPQAPPYLTVSSQRDTDPCLTLQVHLSIWLQVEVLVWFGGTSAKK